MTDELQPLLSPVPQVTDDSEHDAKTVPEKDVKWIIMALFVGSYLSALDTTIVTTLLPTIAGELDSSSQMSWIATSYLLSCSAFQPLYGKLAFRCVWQKTAFDLVQSMLWLGMFDLWCAIHPVVMDVMRG